MRVLLIIIFCLHLSTIAYASDSTKIKPIKSLQFSSGLILNNWIWKFRDAESSYPNLPGWGGKPFYSIDKVDPVKINAALNYSFTYQLEFKILHYDLGFRIAEYPFRQRGSIRIWENDTVKSRGFADIDLLNRTIAPVLGIGTQMNITPKMRYYVKVLFTYNLLCYDPRNTIILYDSLSGVTSSIGINYNIDNMFEPDVGEVSIDNQVNYNFKDNVLFIVSASVWMGNKYLENIKYGYKNIFNLNNTFINYRYVSFNFGIKYRL